MGLTSHKVLALAVLFAAGLFLGTVLLWPRLAHRSWRSVSGRVGLLLGTQLAIFAAVGLAVNQAFGFYATWADLFGQEQGQGVVTDHMAGGNAGPVQVVSTQGVAVTGGERPVVGGQIQKIDITGRTSHIRTPAYVYLPPEYFQPPYARRTFPASVVLTGYPGTAEALIKGLHYPQTGHRLAASGRMQPMILVMLRPTVAPPRDTECVNVPGGPQTETFFAKDLPDELGAHYRTARQWGVVGDSTGGYCALKLAVHHPSVYTAGAGLSPYYSAPTDPTTGDLFHQEARLKELADLKWYLNHMPPPATSLLVTSSKVGEHNYKATLAFIKMVKPPTRMSSIILASGGHNFNTWRREIPATLEWLSQRLSDR
ncbi:esterase family protein [Streptomyces sp. VRA16 Mangrove soil]|uniref:alpha/beta hydrolase n=1 Tax=Streptomyces sp. VRA16 Mangrove soil TaxID=2817434 RepID=UPI001A9FC5E8|nr:alpha/beta hydrolase-fold protein [Streptomyces sp. VRA16 Mangrove soil]MBO1333857.1 esterase [Streptomyces sp. VRA16 Mangrove soil]